MSPLRWVDGAQVPRSQQASVLRPQFQGLDRLARFPVHEQQVQLPFFEEVAFPPLPQGDEHQVKAVALFREPVFLVGAAIRGRAGGQDPVRHQFLQPCTQDVLCQPKALLKFAEPPLAQERVAHN